MLREGQSGKPAVVAPSAWRYKRHHEDLQGWPDPSEAPGHAQGMQVV